MSHKWITVCATLWKLWKNVNCWAGFKWKVEEMPHLWKALSFNLLLFAFCRLCNHEAFYVSATYFWPGFSAASKLLFPLPSPPRFLSSDRPRSLSLKERGRKGDQLSIVPEWTSFHDGAYMLIFSSAISRSNEITPSSIKYLHLKKAAVTDGYASCFDRNASFPLVLNWTCHHAPFLRAIQFDASLLSTHPKIRPHRSCTVLTRGMAVPPSCMAPLGVIFCLSMTEFLCILVAKILMTHKTTEGLFSLENEVIPIAMITSHMFAYKRFINFIRLLTFTTSNFSYSQSVGFTANSRTRACKKTIADWISHWNWIRLPHFFAPETITIVNGAQKFVTA